MEPDELTWIQACNAGTVEQRGGKRSLWAGKVKLLTEGLRGRTPSTVTVSFPYADIKVSFRLWSTKKKRRWERRGGKEEHETDEETLRIWALNGPICGPDHIVFPVLDGPLSLLLSLPSVGLSTPLKGFAIAPTAERRRIYRFPGYIKTVFLCRLSGGP